MRVSDGIVNGDRMVKTAEHLFIVAVGVLIGCSEPKFPTFIGLGGAGKEGGGGVRGTGGAGGDSGVGSGGVIGSSGGVPGAGGRVASGGAGLVGAGGRGEGGASATGGVVETGGMSGAGGRVASGGAGLVGAGGRGEGGGSGTGGAVGTGGMSTECQANQTMCAGTGMMQSCSGGQWKFATACPVHQSCLTTKCECVVDPACAGAPVCATSTSLTTCQQDAMGCIFSSSSACTGDNVCEHIVPSSCADSFWAEWHIPPEAAPTGYKDNGDGTVTDKITGLVWQQGTSTSTMDWVGAQNYCATMTWSGRTDWRLPAKIELDSLIDYGMGSPGPTINMTFFPSTKGALYWSSTPLVGSSAAAWCSPFEGGNGSFDDSTAAHYVRCVR